VSGTLRGVVPFAGVRMVPGVTPVLEPSGVDVADVVVPWVIPRADEVLLRARGRVEEGVKWKAFELEAFELVELFK
jgi:hypothetical protein